MCHLILFLPFLTLPVFWFFPLSTAMPIYLFVLGISLFLYFKIFQAMRLKPRLGKDAMLGKTGIVIQNINPEGKIKYATEIWNAKADGKKFSKGDKIIIHGFWGMKVLVKELRIEKQ